MLQIIRVFLDNSYHPRYHLVDPFFKAFFSGPRGRSFKTMSLLPLGPFGLGLRVRKPFVFQPHGERGCLLDFDFPLPPP